MASITSRIEIHPALLSVPEMDADTYARLKDGLRDQGQLYPILTLGGKVIDGRARLRALRELRMTPNFESVDDSSDPYDVVLNGNVNRTHLEKSQISMLLHRLNRRSPEDLKAAGVSKRMVETASRVHRIAAPEVIRAVDSGKISLNKANRIADLPRDEQPRVVERIESGAKVDLPKPQRKAAQIERPVVAVSDTEVTPERMVALFRECPQRLEAIRQLLAELQEHEQMIASGFLSGGSGPAKPMLAEVKPAEPLVAEKVKDRIGDELIGSPRMAGLGGRLGGMAIAVGTIRLLFAAADRHAPAGDIGKLSDSAIASACNWQGPADVFVSALVQEGWLQRDNEHRLLIVDWAMHCTTEVLDALIASGASFATATGIPKVKEKSPVKRPSNKPAAHFSEAFERFWSAYPDHRKRDKQETWKRWQSALQVVTPEEGETAEDFLIRRATEFAASDVGRSEFANAPAVWLNKGRYYDSPEAWTDKRNTAREEIMADPDFAKFWLAVPETKRVNVADARRAWDGAVSSAKPPAGMRPQDFIIQRMKDYAGSWKGKSKYAATPADWLNAGSYMDSDLAWSKLDDRELERASKVVVRRPMTPIPGLTKG